MTELHRIIALFIAVAALAASAIGADASAKPISGDHKPTVECIRAPCGPANPPKVEHPHKPDVVCIRAPCGPFKPRDLERSQKRATKL
jgi:hypothetical protein